MDILWRELIPIKGISHYQRYFNNYYPLESEKNFQKFKQSEKVKRFYWFMALYSIHTFYLFIYKPKTIDKQMIHYDYLSLANIPYANGAIFIVSAQIIYYMDSLYFKYDNILMFKCYSLIIKRDDSYFIEKRHLSILISDYFRYLAVILLNITQVFVIVVGK